MVVWSYVKLLKEEHKMINDEVDLKRNFLVVKDNDLVQKSRFELSLQEQKTIAYICSMIKPIYEEDDVQYQLEYDFNIREYCKVCGIQYDNGKNYADIKHTLKKLSDRSMWLVLPNNQDEEVLCRWLSKVRISKKSGIARITLDKDLIPYLFDLKERYTAYQLYNILAMKSAFSVRLYELLKSYAFQGRKSYYLEDLKYLLMVENIKSYGNFKDFRRRVLEPAQKEINELTDLKVDFSTVLKGKKVNEIIFNIQRKQIPEQLIAISKIDKKLKV